ncbi:SRPBCC domain-containing protein [Sphaerisporangium sp. TRM90804]|uniref:SRPBCC family protein n=1 Tax=Sphaerisporangium sp. TRM90804 TaxID=3031113 RepID=UPI002448A9FF|nr:SRPBCC domain-containing protein [Sphaerisporangium sp. TRM90804]MDH2429614.1 SRPBCC domain-containing protein [Sphaerisporangium sp. TRM90804]
MSASPTTQPGPPTPNGRQASRPQPVWLAMPDITAATLPPLLSVVARPVSQDRWERLVSEVTVPYSAAEVWSALTEPKSLGRWLAKTNGRWAKQGKESILDFEDGEFFLCRTEAVTAPDGGRTGTLRYLWRWVGIGPATSVTWEVRPRGPEATTVLVTEEAVNPPSDWRSWNGMGWPGILEQLAAHLRSGTDNRWTWRRMGPYIQAELPLSAFEAWEALTSPGAVKHWLQRTTGSLAVGDPMTVMMGDASGTVRLDVTKAVEAAQEFPSYMPYVEFTLARPAWDEALGGRLWIEHAGLGRSLLQVFHHSWEGLRIIDPLPERRLITNFWMLAFRRAQSMFGPPAGAPMGPHGWST